MLLGAADEAGRISDRAQRCSTTIHIATNTTFAAIDDIATARQHGSAAPSLPPHHRRQTATPPATERRTGGSRRSRSGRVVLGRAISLAGSSIPAAQNRSERYRQGHAARSVERGSIGLDPVAEQHHLIFTKKKFAAARDRAAPLAPEDKRPTRLTGGGPSAPSDVDRAVVDDPAARVAGGRRRQQRAARSPEPQRYHEKGNRRRRPAAGASGSERVSVCSPTVCLSARGAKG